MPITEVVPVSIPRKISAFTIFVTGSSQPTAQERRAARREFHGKQVGRLGACPPRIFRPSVRVLPARPDLDPRLVTDSWPVTALVLTLRAGGSRVQGAGGAEKDGGAHWQGDPGAQGPGLPAGRPAAAPLQDGDGRARRGGLDVCRRRPAETARRLARRRSQLCPQLCRYARSYAAMPAAMQLFARIGR